MAPLPTAPHPSIVEHSTAQGDTQEHDDDVVADAALLRDTMRPVLQRLSSHRVQLCWAHPPLLPLASASASAAARVDERMVDTLRTVGALVVPLTRLAWLPSVLPLSVILQGASKPHFYCPASRVPFLVYWPLRSPSKRVWVRVSVKVRVRTFACASPRAHRRSQP